MYRNVLYFSGSDDAAIQVLSMDVRPRVIRIPGMVRVWTTLNITEDLPQHMSARVALTKIEQDGSRLHKIRL